MKGHESIVRLLLSNEADKNVQSLDGSTALHYGKFVSILSIEYIIIFSKQYLASENHFYNIFNLLKS